MGNYRHHISGLFPYRRQAENTLSRLVERGLPRERLFLFAGDSATLAPTKPASSNEVRNEVLVDGAIGTAVGTGIGVVGEIALVAANVSLFAASPLLAPLMLMGWGASLGALVGATIGAGDKAKFNELVHDAVSLGQIVLVAESRSVQETEMAREVFQAAIGDYNDVSTPGIQGEMPARNLASH